MARLRVDHLTEREEATGDAPLRHEVARAELPAVCRVSELAQSPLGRPLKARWHANLKSAPAQAAWIWDREEPHKQMSGAVDWRGSFGLDGASGRFASDAAGHPGRQHVWQSLFGSDLKQDVLLSSSMIPNTEEGVFNLLMLDTEHQTSIDTTG